MSQESPPSGDMPFVHHKDSPAWFLDNIGQKGVSFYATVDDAKVHFRGWNLDDESLPMLMFVHGFGGSTYWWDFLTPFFTDGYRVVAVDLPGMGESEGLKDYHDECFARGIIGVIEQYSLGPLTIIGHSYGGIQSMYAMTLRPDLFHHGIIIDCNVWFPQQKPKDVDMPVRPHKRRSSRAECISKFSLMPPQPQALEFLMGYVAYHSCTHDDEGWYWTSDYRVRTANLIEDADLLTNISVKVDCIFGELSPYNKADLGEAVKRAFPNLGQLIIVPDAYHHIAMDHPLELVDAIQRLLADQ